MDIGIDPLVVIPRGIEDCQRLLGSCGIIEINQRLSVDFLMQDREFRSKFVGIQHAHTESVMPQR